MSCQILLSWSDNSTLFGHSCQIFPLNCRSLIYAEFKKKKCTLDANSRRAVVCVGWPFDANSRRAVVNVLNTHEKVIFHHEYEKCHVCHLERCVKFAFHRNVLFTFDIYGLHAQNTHNACHL